MKYIHTTILSIFALSCISYSQNISNRFFTSGSEIVIDVLPENDIFYSCVFHKGQSIYNLARTFHVDQNLIYQVNKLNPEMPISEGRIVKVPLNKKVIISKPDFNFQKYTHLRVNYIVKPGETLFRIAKIYFDQSVQEVKDRNGLKSENLSVGTVLHMGWIMINQDKTNLQDVTFVPSKHPDRSESIQMQNENILENPAPITETEKAVEEDKWVSDQAIAMWDKKNKTTKSMYVLHNDAKIGSEMELFFPLVRSTVKAKVVGRIPDGTYSEDISIFVSPKVARQLGALDSRFMVTVKYLH